MATRRRLTFLVAALLGLTLALALLGPRPSAAQGESVHLALGNPSGAVADPAQPANFLIVRPQYALGYLRDDGIPRWVAWRLVAADIGPVARYMGNFFRDTTLPTTPAVPIAWYRVRHSDYTGSGYDRGHMVSSEDRTATVEDNRATFILTNVLPQSPQNNRGPWLDLENLGRDLADLGDEIYQVAGPDGNLLDAMGNPVRLPTALASGPVRVPARTWKALLAVPAGAGAPIARVTTATRLVAISIPNDKDDPGVRQTDDWEQYVTTADTVEASTGLDLFDALPPTVQRVIEARADVGALPYTLTISGTAALSATVGAAFPSLAVRVTGPGGEAIPGVAVTFAALGGAANADLAGDVVATATTDADGVAVITAVAGAAEGSYTLEASIAGVFTPAVFSLSNLAPAEAPETRVFLPAVVR